MIKQSGSQAQTVRVTINDNGIIFGAAPEMPRAVSARIRRRNAARAVSDGEKPANEVNKHTCPSGNIRINAKQDKRAARNRGKGIKQHLVLAATH